MSAYNQLPLVTDPAVLTAAILAAMLQALNPTSDPAGWRANEGSPEVALAEEIGAQTAATNASTVNAADVALSGFGTSILNLAPITGAKATIPVTITVNLAGAQVPDGFTVYGLNAAGAQVAFELVGVLTTTSTTATATLSALDVGPDYNGVPAGALTVVTATAAVVTVVATAASSGGVRAETLLEYNARLVANIAILSPGGVRAVDLEIVARNVSGVQRVLALDLYDVTASPPSPVARAVTIFPVDSTGQPLTSAEKTAVQAAVAAVREVNFVVRVADPTYTTLTVSYTALALAGYLPATVAANVNAAVLAFLSPAAWGGTSAGLDDSGVATDWTASPTVYYPAVLGVAQGAEGVRYIQSLTINGGTSNVTLSGPAALPSASSTCTGTVTS